MKNRAALLAASVLFLAVPAFAQRPEDRRPNEQRGEEKHEKHGQNAPRANHGRIPDPPQRRASPSAPPEQDRRQAGHVNNLPHVNNDHWYGHDKPNDRRYHADHPFEHGHFEHFGPSYRYRVERFDADRHSFRFRSLPGTGRLRRTGAGAATATTLWFTKTPIMTAGICYTTFIRAGTFT